MGEPASRDRDVVRRRLRVALLALALASLVGFLVWAFAMPVTQTVVGY